MPCNGEPIIQSEPASISLKCFLLKPLIREVDATCLIKERCPGVTPVSARFIYYPYLGFPVMIGGPKRLRSGPLSGLLYPDNDNTNDPPPNLASGLDCLLCSYNDNVNPPGRIGIIVDLLEGQAAVTDITREQLESVSLGSPPHLMLTVPPREGFPSGRVLNARIAIDDAKKIAVSFLTFVVAKSRWLWRYASNVEPGSPVLILKPFWIVEIQSHPDNAKFLVDAVSGGYHPIMD